jgi:hypothetical protein
MIYFVKNPILIGDMTLNIMTLSLKGFFKTLSLTILCIMLNRDLQYLCRAKDFGHKQDETVQNFVKTESFCYKTCKILPNFVKGHPFCLNKRY